jgi:hypothetical protein
MLDYLYRQPEPGGVPQGKVLVHNSVRPTTGRPGTRGSRIWTQEPDDSCTTSPARSLQGYTRLHSRMPRPCTRVKERKGGSTRSRAAFWAVLRVTWGLPPLGLHRRPGVLSGL